MKHKAFRRMLAALLAAALLAGCGAASSQMTREEGSIAGPPVKTESALPVSTPEADTAPEPENGTETPQELPPLDQRVTNQWEIHKNLQDPAGKVLCLNMEVPRINSASADAARINARLAQCYVEPCKPCLEYPALENGTPWDEVRSVGYYQYWYGDCLSLVMNVYFSADSSQKGQGFCFDFESGTQLTNTQLLERMGADPLALENALRRQVMHTFDAAWDRLGPETDRTQWPYTPEAQKDFRWKQLISVSQPDQLDDLPLLLDTEGSAGVLVRVYYADTRHHLNTRFDLPLDAVAVPADWQQRVLGEWVVFRTEVDGDVCNPAEDGESYTLKLEPGDSPDTVRATLTRISKYGDTTTETRTGVLTRGSVGFAFEGECWQLRCLRPEDENYEWAIALRDDGTMTMANMGGNAEYSYIGWMDLRRS